LNRHLNNQFVVTVSSFTLILKPRLKCWCTVWRWLLRKYGCFQTPSDPDSDYHMVLSYRWQW